VRSGRISNSQRATAHGEVLAATTRSFLENTWLLGSLSREFRALIRYKVSNVNMCRYCSAHQIGYLERFGVTREKIQNIHDIETSGQFDRREKAALNFVEAMVQDSSNISTEITTEFIACFTPKERVEITIVASAMDMLNKINDSLNVPLEDDFLGLAEIKNDTDKV